ncbi:3-deoxy-D-manno-octulosonic acid transferase [Lichenifustis flavocetrariae]|uniref:3-deoxy-D-manno-octulosonic acid transferase n=1 Tax=Lichenifustis flavocetrariae TaxID=2949735 RepID=A0AA41YRC0_9HYPH|nr:3-deoxy-D-manno-octulosonic acid transferase [Lichenifustis flavocetrariae]MCW6507139.1 3-deoxy-D-manno-octulosonic acid transferase [Lichenifustis flavocetrariae]
MSAAPRRSIARALYRGGTALLEAGALPFLHWRLKHGKEDALRLPERLGRTSIPRPPGPLIWLHGASVGEGLALLPLIERLAGRGLQVLLTTGTVSSSRVLGNRMPPGAVHQFAPLDGPRAARRFLDQWRPDLVIFAESELWPNLLGEATRRRIPTALINARMSARSFARWRRLPALARDLLGDFDIVLAQTQADAKRYTALSGRPVPSTGTIKFDAAPPPANPAELAALQRSVAGRPVWIAASTHAGEDQDCCAVHRELSHRLPGLLTIIVPRKVDRGPALVAHAGQLGLSAGLRSRGDAIEPETDIHIADTMGELGLFYRLQTAVFVGKSLVPAGGGQNPIEPAKLGNAVLHGPHTANFAEVYADLDAAGASVRVADMADLGAALTNLLGDRMKLTQAARKAALVIEARMGATERTFEQLQPYLPHDGSRAGS